MDGNQALMDISEVAGRLGITPEAVRKRIARGSMEATKQDGRWYVSVDDQAGNEQDGKIPPTAVATPIPNVQDAEERVPDVVRQDQDDKNRLIEVLQGQVRSQGEELDARRREVQELHVLLQQSSLPPARHTRVWWRRLLAAD